MNQGETTELGTQNGLRPINIQPSFKVVAPQDQKGHLYDGNVVENHDAAQSALGDCNMTGSDRDQPSTRLHGSDSKSSSDKHDDDTERRRSQSEERTSDYKKQRGDWFCLGRILQIWDPNSQKHQKQYVLLDTANIEGLCLVVHGHDHSHHDHHDATFLDDHVLIQKYDDKKPTDIEGLDKVVYLNKRIRAFDEEMWVHLGHADNIDFEKYLCAGRGVLDKKSLKELRQWWLEWWAERWK